MCLGQSVIVLAPGTLWPVLSSAVQGRVGFLMQVWSKSGTVLDSPSQLGTLLEDSGDPGALPRAV